MKRELIIRYFQLQEDSLWVLKNIELLFDWKKIIKSFFLDVFEGQVICAVVLVIVLVVLLVREYLMAQDIPANPAQQPDPVNLEPLIPAAEQQVLNAPNVAQVPQNGNSLNLDDASSSSSLSNSPQYSRRLLDDHIDNGEGPSYNLRPRTLRGKSRKFGKNEPPVVEGATSSSNPFVGKGKLILDEELEAELNDVLPFVDHSIQSLPTRSFVNNDDLLKQMEEDFEAQLNNVEDFKDLMQPLVEPEQALDLEPINEPIIEPQANENDPDLNMVVNFGIADGEIVAQLEVNDVHAFLDLVGVQGPLTRLAQSIALAHIVVMLVLGLGVWVPNLIGNSAKYTFFQILVPSVQALINFSTHLLQKLSDPIVEPIAGAVLHILNVTYNSTDPLIRNATGDNTTAQIDLVEGAIKLVGEAVGDVKQNIPDGPYHQKFFEMFKNDMITAFLGYAVILVSLLIYAVRGFQVLLIFRLELMVALPLTCAELPELHK